MLRLIHNQTISGSILVNDIDDGLPNKSARRGLVRAKVNGSPVLVAGGKLAPASYQRDGSALEQDSSTLSGVNYPKQKCYLPLWSILPGGVYSTTIPGYIDLNTSDRVLLSQDHGVIAGLVKAGLISTATVDPTLTVAPAITSAIVVVSPEALTITGTTFTSVSPDVSSVKIGTTTLTSTQITTGGGTFTATSIVIPVGLLPTITVGSTYVTVNANNKSATALITSAAPTITSATVAAGGAYTLALVGTHFVSLSPDVSSVKIGTTTLTSTQITTGGGTFTDTSIVVPEALVPLSMIVGTTTVTVTADGMTTAAHAIAVTNTTPTLATAHLSTDLTLTGTGLRSILPNLTSVTITGTGAVVLTAAQILGVSGGSISDTTIVIKASLIPGVVTTNSHVVVTANSLTSTPAVDVS